MWRERSYFLKPSRGSHMKKFILNILLIAVIFFSTSCKTIPEDHYNTQKDDAIGTGIGTLLCQAIGWDTEAVLLGAGIGTVIGALAGNAIDQNHQAAREVGHTEQKSSLCG